MEQAEREELIRRMWEWGGAMEGCERRRHEINRLLRQAGDAENILRAQVVTGMPRSGRVGDPTVQAVQMRDEALRRVRTLTEEINAIMESKAAMDAAVGALPDNLQRLLWMRYVRGWTLTVKIPQALYISAATAKRWHDRALENVSSYEPTFGVG